MFSAAFGPCVQLSETNMFRHISLDWDKNRNSVYSELPYETSLGLLSHFSLSINCKYKSCTQPHGKLQVERGFLKIFFFNDLPDQIASCGVRAKKHGQCLWNIHDVWNIHAAYFIANIPQGCNVTKNITLLFLAYSLSRNVKCPILIMAAYI